MTRPEFTDGLVQLSEFFPNFNPPDRSLRAWYLALNEVDTEVYRVALGLICKTETRWWPDTNFAGLIKKYEPEARETVIKRRGENRETDPARMVEEKRLSHAEVTGFLKKIYELANVNGITKKFP
jgi:hypothetical protein